MSSRVQVLSGLADNLRPAWKVTRREVRDQFRDWRIIFPVVGLTLIFPFIMNWTAQRILAYVNQYGATLVGERLVPFLLMIVGFFPISVSLVIALESFVGEKERGSIEPLLHSPLKDWQLYLGKLAASTFPPLLSSYLGMAVYLIGLRISDVTWPPPVILLQVFALTTVQALMMVSGAVVVSVQATSVRAANLLASFIIIPTTFLIQGESLVMFWGNNSTLWWVVFGLFLIAVLLMRVGLAHFRREELLGREIDVLRFRWIWRTFYQAFTGGARSPLDWYRRVIFPLLRRLLAPALLVTLMVGLMIPIGAQQVDRFPFLIPPDRVQDLDTNLQEAMEFLPILGGNTLFLVWWQNVRVLAIAMLLGVFSFGVAGMLPLLATVGVVGFLVEVLMRAGVDLFPILALLLPHGIIEVPVAILATAAVLRIGAALATPDPDRTIGEVLLQNLAAWFQVMVGLVIPLLLVAAAIEVWLTPRIALLLFAQ